MADQNGRGPALVVDAVSKSFGAVSCRSSSGKNAHPDWTKYHEVRASEVQGNAHCSHC
jgi:hypothetical protein